MENFDSSTLWQPSNAAPHAGLAPLTTLIPQQPASTYAFGSARVHAPRWHQGRSAAAPSCTSPSAAAAMQLVELQAAKGGAAPAASGDAPALQGTFVADKVFWLLLRLLLRELLAFGHSTDTWTLKKPARRCCQHAIGSMQTRRGSSDGLRRGAARRARPACPQSHPVETCSCCTRGRSCPSRARPEHAVRAVCSAHQVPPSDARQGAAPATASGARQCPAQRAGRLPSCLMHSHLGAPGQARAAAAAGRAAAGAATAGRAGPAAARPPRATRPLRRRRRLSLSRNRSTCACARAWCRGRRRRRRRRCRRCRRA
jgi:hypothetical protein